MRKFMLAILMVLVVVSSSVYAAESVTQSLQAGGQIQVLQMVWVTDSSGNLTATATGYPVEGFLMAVETVPSATAAPTTLYDVVLNNAQGLDMMGGALGDRSATAAEMTLPLLNGIYTMLPEPGLLTLDVTNAGNSKSGTVRIYFVR